MHDEQRVDVVRWVEALAVPTPGIGDREVVRSIGVLVARGLSGHATVRVLDQPMTTLRRTFRSRGLPPPRDWHAFGRCLRTLRWMRTSDDSIWRSALQSGWSEPASFFRACRRLFRRPPGRLAHLGDGELMNRMVRVRSRPRSPAGARRD